MIGVGGGWDDGVELVEMWSEDGVGRNRGEVVGVVGEDIEGMWME